MIIIICGCVFAAVGFAAVAYVLEAQSRKLSERFTALLPQGPEEDVPEALRASLRERVLGPIMQRANALARRLTPAASVRHTILQLERAGRPWGLTPYTWTLVRVLAAVGCVLGGLVLSRLLPPTGPLRSLTFLAAVAVGLMGPSMVMDRKIKERQYLIRSSLPDVIDLLVVSVEAGMGLDGAVREVISRRKGPLLDELARVLTEIRLGKSRRTAWQEMAIRVDVLELKVFVAALVQAEELGASIATVLRGQSEALRMRRSLAVREVAAALPIKMLFPLIFCIFPGIFVVILGPGMISILTSFRQIGF